jgi:hypothetical protein
LEEFLMDKEKILKSMTNIKPSDAQIQSIENIRAEYKNVIESLNQNCRDSRELSIAITELENSLMWAVKSIVLE